MVGVFCYFIITIGALIDILFQVLDNKKLVKQVDVVVISKRSAVHRPDFLLEY